MSKNSTRSWLGIFLTNSTILVCGIATGIISARLLLPEGRGALAAILFWPTIIAEVGLLNLHTAITQRISKESANIKTITSTGIYLALAVATITIFISYFLLPLLLGSERAEWLSLTRSYLVVFVPFNFVGLVLVAVDHGTQRFTSYNLLRLIPSITYLSGLFVLWSFDAITVANILWVNWAGTFLVAIIRIISNRKQFSTYPSWHEAKGLLAMGSRFKLAGLMALLTSQMDRIVIITLLDNVTIGLYTVAFTFATSGLKIFTSSFEAILFPKLAREDDVVAQGQILAKGLRFSMLMIVLGSLPLIILSPWLIPFLFGNEFKAAVVPAIILFVVYVPMSIQQIIIHSLYSLDKPRPTAINAIITSSVFFVVSWPLGLKFGLVGILIALLLANLVGLYYLLNYLHRQLSLVVKDWWGLNWITLSEVIAIVRSLIVKRIAA